MIVIELNKDQITKEFVFPTSHLKKNQTIRKYMKEGTLTRFQFNLKINESESAKKLIHKSIRKLSNSSQGS